MQLEAYSDFLERHSEDLDPKLETLLMQFPEASSQLRELHITWTTAQRSEIIPIRGFNFWFPRRIASYQILGPLSQTAEETVCLARHLGNGQLLGLKLLAPGCGGEANQLRHGIDEPIDFGQEQGVAYCSFRFGRTPVLASTRELIAADAESARAEKASRPASTAIKAVRAKPLAASPRMQERFARLVDRMRAIWKRPSFSKSSFGIVAIAAGALAFAGSALPQRGVRPSTAEISKAPALNRSGIAFQEMSLDQLDRNLAENPENAEASALRAILLAQEKSKLAWKDYEAVNRIAPNSFAVGFLEDFLEGRLGPKPRTLPSSKEASRAAPSTTLDYALLGLAMKRDRASAASANFTK